MNNISSLLLSTEAERDIIQRKTNANRTFLSIFEQPWAKELPPVLKLDFQPNSSKDIIISLDATKTDPIAVAKLIPNCAPIFHIKNAGTSDATMSKDWDGTKKEQLQRRHPHCFNEATPDPKEVFVGNAIMRPETNTVKGAAIYIHNIHNGMQVTWVIHVTDGFFTQTRQQESMLFVQHYLGGYVDYLLSL